MKKLFLFAALAVFVFGATHAQDLKLGIKGGVNLASIGGDTFTGTGLESRTGFHAGIFAEIPIMDKFSVQPEVLYSSQGSKFSIFGSNGNLQLDYVNVPVMVKYNIIAGLSAELGPVIGVLVSADDDNSATSNDKDNYKTTDIGVAVGASYSLPLGVIAGIRYQKGVSNINESSATSSKNQNNIFQIFVGYSFL